MMTSPIKASWTTSKIKIFAWFARGRVWTITNRGVPLWNSPCSDVELAQQLVGYRGRVNHVTWDAMVGANQWDLFWMDQFTIMHYNLKDEWRFAKREAWMYILRDIATFKAEAEKSLQNASTSITQASSTSFVVAALGMRGKLEPFTSEALIDMCTSAIMNAQSIANQTQQRLDQMKKDVDEWKEVVGPGSWTELV